MKALTLTEPWATLVAIGEKRIETRSWSTNYRGPIAIHAAKGFPRWALETCFDIPFHEVLTRHNVIRMVHGQRFIEDNKGRVVAVAILRDVLPITEVLDSPELMSLPHEEAFGDFGDGRFGWVLDDVQRISPRVECRGAQGLWTVPAHIVRQARDSLLLTEGEARP